MSTTMSDTIDTAKHLTSEGAERAAEAAKHAASSARSTWLDVLRAMTGIAADLRHLHADDALGWLGLERRRGPLASLGVFGVGMAVGAGVGVLFAPASGVETRRRLMAALGLKPEAESAPAPTTKAATAEAKAATVEAKPANPTAEAPRKNNGGPHV